MTDRPHLKTLADRVGILPSYVDISGVEHVTPDATRVAFLEAMGLGASTEAAAERTVEALAREQAASLMPRVRVVTVGEGPLTIPLWLPEDASGEVEWSAEVSAESGEQPGRRLKKGTGTSPAATNDSVDGWLVGAGPHFQVSASGSVHVANGAGPAEVRIDRRLPEGYHTLRVAVELPGRVVEAEQSLIVSPGRCTPLATLVGERQALGLWTNLYALRSARNMGVGDLTDLKQLFEFAGEHNAEFVGINPLHALYNRGEQISPYCPVSRLYRNVLYIDVAAVPELAQCREARALLDSAAFAAELTRLRSSRRVDYDGAIDLKLQVLRLLHDAFCARVEAGCSERGEAYARYIEEQGRSLDLFATFMALVDRLRRTERWGGSQSSWREWPDEYRRPDSPAVEAFRDSNRREVDFHCYLQFELDRQLGAVAETAGESGLALGLYNDLAIGAADEGSDAWAYPDMFARGVHVGAPPDPYSETGQTWGFPPIDPHALRRARYEYWTEILRSSMAHAGLLRIDHVMGLFRQFWVPDGRPATEGAYVRYPSEDLLGILALESQRHRTVIVGEDLGTVPPEVPPTLEKWEILSSSVLYFERDWKGNFLPPSAYSNRVLVTATTHDHPPLAGFFKSRDLDIRREIGLLESPSELEHARAERGADRAALLRRLVAEHLLPSTHDVNVEMFCDAVHKFLTRTPASLIGISLDDLALESDPVNLPGVPFDRYPSWSRRMERSVENLMANAEVKQALRQLCDPVRYSGGGTC